MCVWRVCVCVCVCVCAAPTDLVRHGEGGVEPVVLDDGAAPLRGAHRPHVGHAQGVTGVVPTQVLQDRRQDTGGKNQAVRTRVSQEWCPHRSYRTGGKTQAVRHRQ